MLLRSTIRKEVKGVAGKRKCSVPKNGPVWRQSAEEATLARMPKYNAYACGTGAHGDAKYNRARHKQAWIRELDKEGPANRGAFPFDLALMGQPSLLEFRNRPSSSPSPRSWEVGFRSEPVLRLLLEASQTGYLASPPPRFN